MNSNDQSLIFVDCAYITKDEKISPGNVKSSEPINEIMHPAVVTKR